MNRREFITKTALGAAGLAVLPATTGFAAINKIGLQKGEIHAIAGFSHTPVENFKLITLDFVGFQWSTLHIPAIGKMVDFQWCAKPEGYPGPGFEFDAEPLSLFGEPTDIERVRTRLTQKANPGLERIMLGDCLLVVSPSGIRYWELETEEYNTESLCYWQDAEKFEKQDLEHTEIDWTVCELAAEVLFKQRNLMLGRDYQEHIDALVAEYHRLTDIYRMKDPHAGMEEALRLEELDKDTKQLL